MTASEKQRSEEHTSELQSHSDLVCRLLLEKKREIINLIAYQSLNLNSIAENFDVSRPAISQHIKILIECGLIVIKKQGRERYCEAKLQRLNQVAAWAERYRQLWADKFDVLDKLLIDMQAKNKRKQRKK